MFGFSKKSEPLCPFFKTPCLKEGCTLFIKVIAKKEKLLTEVGACSIPIMAQATIEGNDALNAAVEATNGVSKNVETLRSENMALAPVMIGDIVMAIARRKQIAEKEVG